MKKTIFNNIKKQYKKNFNHFIQKNFTYIPKKHTL